MTVKQIAKEIKKHNNFLVLTHIRPDGDTVGCGAALCCALQSLGKTAYLYKNPQLGDAFPWLTDPYVEPEGYEYDYVVAVDTASESMFPMGFKGKAQMCIDHHPSNTHYAPLTLVGQRASCGEVVMEVIKELMPIDSKLADMLYLALSTDCGCFQYGNTDAQAFRNAAELFEAGANVPYLNKLLFRTSSVARLKLEGMVYSTLRYYDGGLTVISIITKKMIEECGVTEPEMQDIAALPGRVAGCATSAVVREIGENVSKISLRTNGVVDAVKICGRFGGGGHKMASGCRMDQDCFEAAQILAAAISEEYK